LIAAVRAASISLCRSFRLEYNDLNRGQIDIEVENGKKENKIKVIICLDLFRI
jgi:hypothetical protein